MIMVMMVTLMVMFLEHINNSLKCFPCVFVRIELDEYFHE